MRLNLGSGQDYRKRFINYDDDPVGDVVGNMEEGLPFKDESFTEILASHVLEHIHDLRKLKRELHRVLERGGVLGVVVPDYLSPDAWGDDTHCRAFSLQSFMISDFWPGWKLHDLQTSKRIKLATQEEVTWIHALYERT